MILWKYNSYNSTYLSAASTICKPELHWQANRNYHQLIISDQELVTIYLFGHLNEHFEKRAIYRFIKHYWAAWFPALPSYQAFSRRLNLRAPT